MAKQFFKNLPDTSTPLEASRLNGLLDGEEAMGNLVVDSIKSKNLIDRNALERTANGRYSLLNTGIRATTTGTGQNQYAIYKLPNSLLGKTCTLSCVSTSSASNIPLARIYYGYPSNSPDTYVNTNAGFDLYGTGTKQITTTFLSSFPTNCTNIYLLLYANRDGTGFSSGAYCDYTNLQLEEGSEATSYSLYQDFNNDITSYTLSNTPATGVTNAYSIHRIGNYVTFNCDIIWISSLPANTWTTIGNIPTSIYPTDGHDIQTIATIIDGSTGNIIGSTLFQVKTTGEVRIKPNVAYSGSFVAGIIAYASWVLDRR